jgi:hypothetical protein
MFLMSERKSLVGGNSEIEEQWVKTIRALYLHARQRLVSCSQPLPESSLEAACKSSPKCKLRFHRVYNMELKWDIRDQVCDACSFVAHGPWLTCFD